MMEGNPFQELADALCSSRSGFTPFRFGTVIALAPLTVDVAGTTQSGNLQVNAALLERRYPVSDGVSVTVPAALAPGDSVLLFTVDDQSFIVLCKVVDP